MGSKRILRSQQRLDAVPLRVLHHPAGDVRLALDLALAEDTIEVVNVRQAMFQSGQVGGDCPLLDLPPSDTSAEGDVLLPADGDNGNRWIGAQCSKHLGFLPLVVWVPHTINHKVRVVHHLLQLVASCERLQGR